MADVRMSGVETASRAEAFRLLAAEHLDEAYRLSRAILGSQAEAEDATHDAFVRAWRKWGSLRDPSRFDAWFSRILVNTCRNRLRRMARHRGSDLSDELARRGPDPFRQADDRDQLAAALADLSIDHRVVVALRFYRDLSTRQIAEQLGVREGTVSSRLHYALHQLRTALDAAERPGANDG